MTSGNFVNTDPNLIADWDLSAYPDACDDMDRETVLREFILTYVEYFEGPGYDIKRNAPKLMKNANSPLKRG